MSYITTYISKTKYIYTAKLSWGKMTKSKYSNYNLIDKKYITIINECHSKYAKTFLLKT